MGDSFTTREDMDRERRRKEDPCFHGHGYIETNRRSRSRDCIEFQEGHDSDGFRETSKWLTEIYWDDVTYRCERCGNEIVREENETKSSYGRHIN
jgi:hypothetical protein